MNNTRWMIVALLCLCGAGDIQAQQFQQIGPSQFWETLPAVNGVIIGQPGAQTAGVGLLVDGGALATPVTETFRTRVPSGNNQNWSMYRNTVEIGRLSHTNPSNAFTVQARQADGNLWLRNSALDGIRVNFNGPNGTVNGYTLDRQGYAALGNNAAINIVGTPNPPWSRWHLVHNNPGATLATGGFRGWMRNGMIGTGNSDLFYLGHKYAINAGNGAELDDNSDVIAAWFDDILPAGAAQAFNNYSYRFLGNLGVGGSAGTDEGLEILRLRPYRLNANDPIQGFVGIGDWVNAGGAMPDERLDLLNNTIRLRSFSLASQQNYQNNAADRVLVADPADGRVYWRPASSIGGANSDCKWTLLGNNNITTAYAGNPGCPQENNRVGIGTGDPVRAKLEVVDNPNANQTFPYGQIGVQVDVRGRATTYQAGVDVLFDPGPPFGEGPQVAPASRTGVNVYLPGGGNLLQGVNAYSVGSAASTLVYGVNTEADVQSTTNAGALGIGMRSRAVGNGSATIHGLQSQVVNGNGGSYAANLIGNLNVIGNAFTNGGTWNPSDG